MIEVRHINLPISDALRDFARKRVERALRPFRGRVRRVEVRISDTNGPRGGVDKRCVVTVRLALPGGPKIVIQSARPDAYAAVQRSCDRLGRAIARALERRQRLERFGRPAESPAELYL